MDPPRCYIISVAMLYSLVLNKQVNPEGLHRFATLEYLCSAPCIGKKVTILCSKNEVISNLKDI